MIFNFYVIFKQLYSTSLFIIENKKLNIPLMLYHSLRIIAKEKTDLELNVKRYNI